MHRDTAACLLRTWPLDFIEKDPANFSPSNPPRFPYILCRIERQLLGRSRVYSDVEVSNGRKPVFSLFLLYGRRFSLFDPTFAYVFLPKVAGVRIVAIFAKILVSGYNREREFWETEW